MILKTESSKNASKVEDYLEKDIERFEIEKKWLTLRSDKNSQTV
jgi:type IV secretory pathway VirD2 relaxase